MSDKKLFKQQKEMPWVPEVGEMLKYRVASSEHEQMGICCGYQVWSAYNEENRNSHVRFHVLIAIPTDPNKQINMRWVQEVTQPTQDEISAYWMFIAIDKLLAEEDAKKVSQRLASSGFGKVD